MPKVCCVCGKKAAHQCPCKDGTYYCGHEHQKNDWARHKYDCRKYRESRLAKAEAKAEAQSVAGAAPDGSKLNTNSKAGHKNTIPESAKRTREDANEGSSRPRKGPRKYSRSTEPPPAVPRRKLRSSDKGTDHTSDSVDLNSKLTNSAENGPGFTTDGTTSYGVVEAADHGEADTAEKDLPDTSEETMAHTKKSIAADTTRIQQTVTENPAREAEKDIKSHQSAIISTEVHNPAKTESDLQGINTEMGENSAETKNTQQNTETKSTVADVASTGLRTKEEGFMALEDLPAELVTLLKSNSFSAYNLMDLAASLNLQRKIDQNQFMIPCEGNLRRNIKCFFNPRKTRGPYKKKAVQSANAGVMDTKKISKTQKKSNLEDTKSKDSLQSGSIWTTLGATDDVQRRLRELNNPSAQQQHQQPPHQQRRASEQTPHTQSESEWQTNDHIQSNTYNQPAEQSGAQEGFQNMFETMSQTQCYGPFVPDNAPSAPHLAKVSDLPGYQHPSQVAREATQQNMQQQFQYTQQQPRMGVPSNMQQPQNTFYTGSGSNRRGTSPQSLSFAPIPTKGHEEYVVSKDGRPLAPPPKIFTTLGATNEVQRQLRELNGTQHHGEDAQTQQRRTSTQGQNQNSSETSAVDTRMLDGSGVEPGTKLPTQQHGVTEGPGRVSTELPSQNTAEVGTTGVQPPVITTKSVPYSAAQQQQFTQLPPQGIPQSRPYAQAQPPYDPRQHYSQQQPTMPHSSQQVQHPSNHNYNPPQQMYRNQSQSVQQPQMQQIPGDYRRTFSSNSVGMGGPSQTVGSAPAGVPLPTGSLPNMGVSGAFVGADAAGVGLSSPNIGVGTANPGLGTANFGQNSAAARQNSGSFAPSAMGSERRPSFVGVNPSYVGSNHVGGNIGANVHNTSNVAPNANSNIYAAVNTYNVQQTQQIPQMQPRTSAADGSQANPNYQNSYAQGPIGTPPQPTLNLHCDANIPNGKPGFVGSHNNLFQDPQEHILRQQQQQQKMLQQLEEREQQRREVVRRQQQEAVQRQQQEAVQRQQQEALHRHPTVPQYQQQPLQQAQHYPRQHQQPRQQQGQVPPMLLLSGLNSGWNETLILKLLEGFGRVLAITMYPGYAFVTMDSLQALQNAITSLHGTDVCGSQLSLTRYNLAV